MKPEVEQELAHVLLVELLAHQFTFPVKWIDTQNELLMEQGVERLIEIGPAPTLTNMAKRTMESLYDGCDPQIRNREFLSSSKDADKVYYRTEPVIEEQPKVQTAQIPQQPVKPAPVAAPIEVPVVVTSIPMTADLPLTASYVLRTMIALKLKKTAAEIDASSSIKKLAGGRSTMENEIVGDLIAEFKNLPDRPEEQAISSLAEGLEPSFGGSFGSQSSLQVAKLFSSRMPGGFTPETAREYLKTNWALSAGRTSMVLLLAVTAAPEARLKTYEAAEAYLDDLVNKHSAETGTPMSKGSQAQASTQAVAIDSTALKEIEQARKELSEKKIQAYAQDLGIDLRAGEKKAAATQVALDEALGELDLWNAEHGPTYATGIKPLVEVSKARSYKSWSHWVAQDLTCMFNQMMNGQCNFERQEFAARLLHISNCADSRLTRRIRSLAAIAKQSENEAESKNSTVLESLATLCERAAALPPVFLATYQNMMPITEMDFTGEVTVKEVPRQVETARTVLLLGEKEITIPVVQPTKYLEYPTIAIKSQESLGWKNNEEMSNAYVRAIYNLNNPGLSFSDKKVLVTGAGAGSIGAEILKGLLAGGAHVICTTSRLSSETAEIFREIYASNGGKGSRLVILPFNQASHQDVETLVSYIYAADGLNWDLDLILPFAAIPESDRDIDQIDAKSELAHRAMLTNTIRLLGNVKRQKSCRGIDTRPAQVLLPLSSNHGIIGRDGLYAESKLALEGLMHKWHSEDWASYLSLCGVEIGWTRGTGLMSANDIVAAEVEKLGIRTFSRQEMAANILALCAPAIESFCQEGPIMADLNGGLDKIKNLGAQLRRIRASIQQSKSEIRAVSDAKKLDTTVAHGSLTIDETPRISSSRNTCHAAELSTLPEIDYKTQVEPLAARLRGMVDLDRVAVVTGFAELGPFGSARTRMQMELKNGFTNAGCVELAWTMGLIKRPAVNNDNGLWIDSETGKSIPESDIKEKYEEQILQHTGIRFVKSEVAEPQMLQEIVLEADLAPISTTAAGAVEYAKLHGQNAEIWQEGTSDEWRVVLKAGATLMIPKAKAIGPTPVGKIPQGWNAKNYGIDNTIISQVDTVTLYTLIATVEALLSSGIPDFYSLYKHIHTSEVANCMGSGQGGMNSLTALFRGRHLDQNIQNDILQETFANTTGAWINMLLLGASGPIRTPVGACATALEALDSAADLIHNGQVKLALVGGVEDWSYDVGAEFRNMRATVDGSAEDKAGRSASEASRPMATTRSGFVEGQGSGIQVVASARLALDLGLPIHGIIAFTGLASDKPGRSVPAPGKGLLNFAAPSETSQFPSPMLDITYRRRLLQRRLSQIEQSHTSSLEDLDLELSTIPESQRAEYTTTRTAELTRETHSARKSTVQQLGNNFHRTDPRIAPLAGSLSVWGLTASDIRVLCMHGTSTSKGDTNEATVLNTQLSHLGRKTETTPPALAVCSKWLTGHAKGAAGAWALNTGLQILATGIVPRNGNLDDLSPELVGLEHVAFLGGRGEGLQMAGGVDVVSVSAFGFGQKGAQALIVHPRFLFAVLEGGEEEFERYWVKMKARRRVARRELLDGMWRGDLVGKRIVSEGIWCQKGVREEDVLLDRSWRA